MNSNVRNVVLLLVAGGIGWAIWYHMRPVPTVAWQGYAEADFLKIGPTQAGQLTKLGVQRGDLVKPGTLLFAQDDALDLAALQQAQQQLGQAQAQLRNLQGKSRAQQIDQAQSNLAGTAASLNLAQINFNRNQSLFSTHTIGRQALDQSQSELLVATAQNKAAAAALAQLQQPVGRASEIEAQNFAVQAATAAVAAAQWHVAQREVRATVDARVADTEALPGETIAAGAPVVSLLPPGNIFVRFFVPETALASLQPGQQVKLACDNCPKDLTGTISFINSQSEYTPPVIYSESSKAKLVFMVEARPPPESASLLHPGEPITVMPLQQMAGASGK
ncbi:MAG: HlyD family efflux transporter periplasmic adaptor subunit [Hyphomicrobiales bacterium]|nr:HlyD family efflux transporter periplasmic adaptor subunit [Hyphomicrobiales bacterium]MDE2115445.1 HlyD family efflux transporter periplasmic adaptor subunit [Hyphomicrobiales bacterium]